MQRILIIAILITFTFNLNAQISNLSKQSIENSATNFQSISERLEKLNILISKEESADKKSELYYQAAALNYELGNFQESVNYYTESLKYSTQPDIYIKRAYAYFKLKDFDNTLDDLNSHLTTEGREDDIVDIKSIYKIKAECYFQKADYENVVVELSNFLDYDDSDSEILIQRGLALGILGKYKESVLDLTKVLNLKSNLTTRTRVFALNTRSSSKGNLNDTYGAFADLNQAITLDPLNIESHLGRAGLYFEKKNYSLALKDYNKVLSIEKDNIDALVNRAKLKIILKDKKGGCIDLSRAGELGSDEAYDLIKEYCN